MLFLTVLLKGRWAHECPYAPISSNMSI